MKLLLTLVLILSALPCIASSWVTMPMPKIYQNYRGNYILRVHTMPGVVKNGCFVYEYDRDSQDYLKKSEFSHPENLGGNLKIFVEESGNYILFIAGYVEWSDAKNKKVIIVTDTHGSIVHEYKLDDLFSELEVKIMKSLDERDITVWLSRAIMLKGGSIFLDVRDSFGRYDDEVKQLPNFRFSIINGTITRTNDSTENNEERLFNVGFTEALADTTSSSNKAMERNFE